jgi:hypothetical protein
MSCISGFCFLFLTLPLDRISPRVMTFFNFVWWEGCVSRVQSVRSFGLNAFLSDIGLVSGGNWVKTMEKRTSEGRI